MNKSDIYWIRNHGVGGKYAFWSIIDIFLNFGFKFQLLCEGKHEIIIFQIAYVFLSLFVKCK